MANKIGVLDAQQNAAIDSPVRYVKRVVAHYLVGHQLAVKVGKYLIQMVGKSISAHSDVHRFLKPDLPFADYDYPESVFDPSLKFSPGLKYPLQLAPQCYA